MLLKESSGISWFFGASSLQVSPQDAEECLVGRVSLDVSTKVDVE